jgi:hypothetical protein
MMLSITARHPQHVLALFDGDPMLQAALIASDHPACRRLVEWIRDELLPAVDLDGLRGEPGAGNYRWPGTAAEFDQMVSEALSAALPGSARVVIS